MGLGKGCCGLEEPCIWLTLVFSLSPSQLQRDGGGEGALLPKVSFSPSPGLPGVRQNWNRLGVVGVTWFMLWERGNGS